MPQYITDCVETLGFFSNELHQLAPHKFRDLLPFGTLVYLSVFLRDNSLCLAMAPLPQVTFEYIQEDSAKRLFEIAYTLIVLETIVIVGYFVSRYIKQPAGHREMPYLMAGSYMFCVGLPILSLCKLATLFRSQFLFP